MFFKSSVLRCFAVFCGVICAVFCVAVFLAFFTKQHKTDQKVYKTHKKRTKYALCNTNTAYSTIRCCASFSHSENVYKKHSQNTSKTEIFKTLQNIRKTPQNTVFQKTLAKHHKTPAKHPQNTPQNTAKHHKTHLLTKQTELANKPLRSPLLTL